MRISYQQAASALVSVDSTTVGAVDEQKQKFSDTARSLAAAKRTFVKLAQEICNLDDVHAVPGGETNQSQRILEEQLRQISAEIIRLSNDLNAREKNLSHAYQINKLHCSNSHGEV